LKGVELKFYNPEIADLRVRGRMKEVQGVMKLLMYTKVEQGKYETIETDVACTKGALYKNIWNLIWSLANELNSTQKDEYVNLYKNA
jgi:hypothetical protein